MLEVYCGPKSNYREIEVEDTPENRELWAEHCAEYVKGWENVYGDNSKVGILESLEKDGSWELDRGMDCEGMPQCYIIGGQ